MEFVIQMGAQKGATILTRMADRRVDESVWLCGSTPTSILSRDRVLRSSWHRLGN